jgi:hypothetical protein
MDPNEVEVSFCELCGTSVPAGDLEAGHARHAQGKTVGRCCITELFGGEPAATAGPTAVPAAASAVPRGEAGKLLPVLLCALVAVIGGTLYLDGRLSAVGGEVSGLQADIAARQRADSEALQDLGLKLDDAPTAADVGQLDERLAALAAELAEQREAAAGRGAVLDQELDGLRRAQRATEARIVDYRPLFEDLRQRHSRALAVLEGLRDRPAAGSPAATPVAAEVTPKDPSPPAAELPASLAEQVVNLGAADPALRFEAVDVLIESKEPKVLPHLLPLVRDPDAFVRRLTVEGLREFRRPEAVDALLEALADADENVCDTAWRSLRDLTGQRLPFDASASKEARARAAKKWQEWWQGARDSFGS